jgi:hypothetical protein
MPNQPLLIVVVLWLAADVIVALRTGNALGLFYRFLRNRSVYGPITVSSPRAPRVPPRALLALRLLPIAGYLYDHYLVTTPEALILRGVIYDKDQRSCFN